MALIVQSPLFSSFEELWSAARSSLFQDPSVPSGTCKQVSLRLSVSWTRTAPAVPVPEGTSFSFSSLQSLGSTVGDGPLPIKNLSAGEIESLFDFFNVVPSPSPFCFLNNYDGSLDFPLFVSPSPVFGSRSENLLLSGEVQLPTQKSLVQELPFDEHVSHPLDGSSNRLSPLSDFSFSSSCSFEVVSKIPIRKSHNRTKTKFMYTNSNGLIGFSDRDNLSGNGKGRPGLIVSPSGKKLLGFESTGYTRVPAQCPRIEKKLAEARRKVRFRNWAQRCAAEERKVQEAERLSRTVFVGSIPVLVLPSPFKTSEDEMSAPKRAGAFLVGSVVVDPSFEGTLNAELRPRSSAVEEPDRNACTLPTSHAEENPIFHSVRKSELFPLRLGGGRGDFVLPSSTVICRRDVFRTPGSYTFEPRIASQKKVVLSVGEPLRPYNGDGVYQSGDRTSSLLHFVRRYLRDYHPIDCEGFFTTFKGKDAEVRIFRDGLRVRVFLHFKLKTFSFTFNCSSAYLAHYRCFEDDTFQFSLLSRYRSGHGRCYLDHVYYCSILYGVKFDADFFELGTFPRVQTFKKRLVEKFGQTVLHVPLTGYRSGRNTFHYNFWVHSEWTFQTLPAFIGGDNDDERAPVITEISKYKALEEVLHKTGGKDSILGLSVERDLIAFKDQINQYRADKDKVVVPFYMSQATQDSLSRYYPQFDIQFKNHTHSDHPAAAASRSLENYTLSRLCGGNFSDIGGCPIFHMRNSGCYGVHVCRPVYDSKDAQRRVTRQHQLRNVVKSFTHEELVSASSRIDICSHPLGECDKKSDSLVLVQVYDASLAEVCKAMSLKNASVAYLTMVTPGELLDDREAFSVPELNCDIYVSRGQDTVDYKFGSSCYTHRLSNITEYMKTDHIVQDFSFFSVEMYEIRMSVNYYKITRSNFAPTIHADRVLRYPRVCKDLTLVKLPRYDKKTKRCLPGVDKLYIDSAFVSRVYDYVVNSCTVVNAKTFEWVWSYIKSSKSRVVISGKMIHRDVELDIKYRESFAAVMLAAGVRGRIFSQHFAQTINVYCGDAPLLKTLIFYFTEALSMTTNSISEAIKSGLKSCLSSVLGVEFLDIDDVIENVGEYVEVKKSVDIQGFGEIEEKEESKKFNEIISHAIDMRSAVEAMKVADAKAGKDETQGRRKPNQGKPKKGLFGGSKNEGFLRRLISSLLKAVELGYGYLYSSWDSLLTFLSHFQGIFASFNLGSSYETLRSILGSFKEFGFTVSSSISSRVFQFSFENFSAWKDRFGVVRDVFLKFSREVASGSASLGSKLKCVLCFAGSLFAFSRWGRDCRGAKIWKEWTETVTDTVVGSDIWATVSERVVTGFSVALAEIFDKGFSGITMTSLLRKIAVAFFTEFNLNILIARGFGPATTFSEFFFRANVNRIVTTLVSVCPKSALVQTLIVSELVPTVLRFFLNSNFDEEDENLSMYEGYINHSLSEVHTLKYASDRLREKILDARRLVESTIEGIVENAYDKISSRFSGDVLNAAQAAKRSVCGGVMRCIPGFIKNYKLVGEDREEEYHSCDEGDEAPGLRGGSRSGRFSSFISRLAQFVRKVVDAAKRFFRRGNSAEDDNIHQFVSEYGTESESDPLDADEMDECFADFPGTRNPGEITELRELESLPSGDSSPYSGSSKREDSSERNSGFTADVSDDLIHKLAREFRVGLDKYAKEIEIVGCCVSDGFSLIPSKKCKLVSLCYESYRAFLSGDFSTLVKGKNFLNLIAFLLPVGHPLYDTVLSVQNLCVLERIHEVISDYLSPNEEKFFFRVVTLGDAPIEIIAELRSESGHREFLAFVDGVATTVRVDSRGRASHVTMFSVSPGLRGGSKVSVLGKVFRLAFKVFAKLFRFSREHLGLALSLFPSNGCSYVKIISKVYGWYTNPALNAALFPVRHLRTVIKKIDELALAYQSKDFHRTVYALCSLNRALRIIQGSDAFQLLEDSYTLFEAIPSLIFSMLSSKKSEKRPTFRAVDVVDRETFSERPSKVVDILEKIENEKEEMKKCVEGHCKPQEKCDSDEESPNYAFSGAERAAGNENFNEGSFTAAGASPSGQESDCDSEASHGSETSGDSGDSDRKNLLPLAHEIYVSDNLKGKRPRNRSRNKRGVCIFLQQLNDGSNPPVPCMNVIAGKDLKAVASTTVREFYYLQEMAVFELFTKLHRYYLELETVKFERKAANCGQDAELSVLREGCRVVAEREGTSNVKDKSDYAMYFCQDGLVPFSVNKFKNGVLHTQTKFIAANAFLYGYQNSRNFTFTNSDVRVMLYEAPPGGGKTTTLIDIFLNTRLNLRSCRVLTANKNSREDILEKVNDRLSELHDEPVDCCESVLTIDAFLMNYRDRDCDILLVDECFMVHAGAVVACLEFTRCKLAVLFGDSRQIPYISRNELDKALYGELNDLIGDDQRVYGEVSYRCPWDVCAWLSTFYPQRIATSKTNTEGKSSMKICEIESEEDVPFHDNYHYLTMLQSEKKNLLRALKKKGLSNVSRVLTVHEAQGETYSHVHLVRTKFQDDSPFTSINHITVALSRHTDSLTYNVLSSRKSDQISDAIKLSKELVEKFRVYPTSFGGSTLSLDGVPDPVDNSKCKAISSPISVINDFLEEVVPGSTSVEFGNPSAELSSEPFESGADKVSIKEPSQALKTPEHEEQRL